LARSSQQEFCFAWLPRTTPQTGCRTFVHCLCHIHMICYYSSATRSFLQCRDAVGSFQFSLKSDRLLSRRTLIDVMAPI
jgi:hypothetical protein